MSFFKTLSNTAQTLLKTVDVAATKTVTILDTAGASVDELSDWTNNAYKINRKRRKAQYSNEINNIVNDVRRDRIKAEIEILNEIEACPKFAAIYKETEEEYKAMLAELHAEDNPKS